MTDGAWSPEDDPDFNEWCEDMRQSAHQPPPVYDYVAPLGSYFGRYKDDVEAGKIKNDLSIMQTPPQGGPTAHRKRDKAPS